MIAAQDLLAGHKVTQEKLDRAMNHAAQSKPRQEVLEVFDLEWHGGQCPRCGREWIPVIVKNLAADFLYFKPNCHCFSHCKRAVIRRPNKRIEYRPGCGKLMMEEERLGYKFCTNCGAEWIRE